MSLGPSPSSDIGTSLELVLLAPCFLSRLTEASEVWTRFSEEDQKTIGDMRASSACVSIPTAAGAKGATQKKFSAQQHVIASEPVFRAGARGDRQCSGVSGPG